MKNSISRKLEVTPVTITLSILLSLFCAIGLCFNAYGEAIGHIIPAKLVLYMAINFIWVFPVTCMIINSKEPVCTQELHLEKAAFITTLCSCLIYAAIWFPGNMSYDALFQIEQYCGNYPITNHHPIFVTFGFGLLFSLGSKISDEFGLFLIIISNIALWTTAVTFTMHKLCKWKIKRNTCLLILCFYIFFPIIQIYVITASKDTWFFPVVLMFFIEYLDLYESEKTTFKNYILLFALGSISCFIRHGMPLVIFPAMIALAIKQRNNKKVAAMCIVVMLATSIGLTAFEKAYPKSLYDQYSTLFQLTARHLILYPEDVSDKEYEIINNVLDAEEIKDVYNPQVSDDVKCTTLKRNPSKVQINTYLKCWTRMFARHPIGYIEGFLNGCYGYLDPLTYSVGHYNKNNDFLGTPCELYIMNRLHEGNDAPERNIERHSIYEPARRISVSMAVLSAYSRLGATGIWTWIIIWSFGILWRKKRYDLIPVCLMPILQVGICMLSPVNTNLRYALPQMVFSLVLIIWCMAKSPAAETKAKKFRI